MATRRVVKPSGTMKSLAEVRKSRGVLIPELKAVALKNKEDGHPGGWDHIHPSEMAKADWCHRATYYRLTTGKEMSESFSFVLESIFDEGNEIHAKWQRRMRQTKKLWGSWKCVICKQWSPVGWEPSPMEGRCLVDHIMHIWEYAEVSLGDKPSLIWGHEDGAMIDPVNLKDTFDPYMVEIKSIGVGTLRVDALDFLNKYYVETVDGDMVYNLDKLWSDLSRPLPSHVRQANVYLWLARQMDLPFKSVRFLYEFKANQQTKEFVVKLSEDILEPLLTKAEEVRYALKKRKPPECPKGGCKQCMAYETEVITDAGKACSERTGQRTGPVSSGGVKRRRPAVRDSGDKPEPVGSPSRRRVPARRSPGPDGSPRPGADESLPVRGSLAPVPDAPAGGSGGRRIVLRKRTDPDRGTQGL